MTCCSCGKMFTTLRRKSKCSSLPDSEFIISKDGYESRRNIRPASECSQFKTPIATDDYDFDKFSSGTSFGQCPVQFKSFRAEECDKQTVSSLSPNSSCADHNVTSDMYAIEEISIGQSIIIADGEEENGFDVLEPPAEWTTELNNENVVINSFSSNFAIENLPAVNGGLSTFGNTMQMIDTSSLCQTFSKPPVPKKPEYLKSSLLKRSLSDSKPSSPLLARNNDHQHTDTPSSRKASVIVMEDSEVHCQNGDVCHSFIKLSNLNNNDKDEVALDNVDKLSFNLNKNVNEANGYCSTNHARSKSVSSNGDGMSLASSPGSCTIRSESGSSWEGASLPSPARQKKMSTNLLTMSFESEVFDTPVTNTQICMKDANNSKTMADIKSSEAKPRKSLFTSKNNLKEATNIDSNERKSKKLPGLQNWYHQGISSLFKTKKANERSSSVPRNANGKFESDDDVRVWQQNDLKGQIIVKSNSVDCSDHVAIQNRHSTNQSAVRSVKHQHEDSGSSSECYIDSNCRCILSPWLLVPIDHWDGCFVNRWLISEGLEDIQNSLPGK